jgi:hypothetical protein
MQAFLQRVLRLSAFGNVAPAAEDIDRLSIRPQNHGKGIFTPDFAPVLAVELQVN